MSWSRHRRSSDQEQAVVNTPGGVQNDTNRAPLAQFARGVVTAQLVRSAHVARSCAQSPDTTVRASDHAHRPGGVHARERKKLGVERDDGVGLPIREPDGDGRSAGSSAQIPVHQQARCEAKEQRERTDGATS